MERSEDVGEKTIELIPLYEPPSIANARRKPKALQAGIRADETKTNATLEQFIARPDKGTSPSHIPDEDVVMGEDGTMTLDSL